MKSPQEVSNLTNTMGEGMNALRIFTEYTKSQKQTLVALQNVVTHSFKIETKGTIFESNEKGIPVFGNEVLSSQLQKAKNPDRMSSNSPLCVFANSLLLDVAQYLQEREKGFINPTYPNDPIHLFCLHFIAWIQTQLGVAECKKETLNEIATWRDYFQKLLDEHIFKYAERKEAVRTVNVLIKNAINTLDSISDFIELELSRNTIKKELDSLLNKGKNFSSFCFEYLLYILNNSAKIPVNFSIVNLNIGNLQLLPDIKEFIEKTHLGRCLGLLGQTASMHELFMPDIHKTIKPITDNLGVIVGHKDNMSARFLSKAGESRQELIARLSQSQISSCSGFVDFELNTDKEGWNPKEKQATALNPFVRICGLLGIFSQILLHCREAAYLSGKTGDLLLCKLTKHQLLFLMDSFNELVSLLWVEVSHLNKIAHQLDDSLIEGNTKNTSWQRNFARANHLFEKIRIIVGSNDSFSFHTRAIENSIDTLKQQIEETHDRLFLFVKDIHQTVTQFHWLAPTHSLRQLSYPVEPFLQAPPSAPRIRSITQGKLEGQTFFSASLDGQTIYLHPMIAPVTPDFIFQALELDRDEFLDYLLEVCGRQEHVWKYFIPEIKAFLINKPLPAKFAYFCESFTTYNKAYVLIRELSDLMRNEVEKSKESHAPSLYGMTPIDVFKFAEQDTVYQKRFADRIATVRRCLNDNEELLENYCGDQAFVTIFIQYYYKELRSGLLFQPHQTSILDAISELEGYEIVVWMNEPVCKPIHRVKRQATSDTPIRHLLLVAHEHQHVYSGFQYLLNLNQPWSQSTLLSASEFFGLDSKILFNQAKMLEEQYHHEAAIHALNILILRGADDGALAYESSMLFFMRGRNLLATKQAMNVQWAIKDFELAITCSFDTAFRAKVEGIKSQALSLVKEPVIEELVSSAGELLPVISPKISQMNGLSLLKSAKENDREACQALIDLQIDITACDASGNTVLHVTTDYQLLLLFLEQGAKKILDVKNKQGETALFYHTRIVCTAGHLTEDNINKRIEIIKALLNAGANPNSLSLSPEQPTPLYIALHGNREIESLIDVLIKFGANVRARTTTDEFPAECSSTYSWFGSVSRQREISRFVDERFGKQAACGMQAWHTSQHQAPQIQSLQTGQSVMGKEVQQLQKDYELLKRQMHTLQSASVREINKLREENMRLKARSSETKSTSDKPPQTADSNNTGFSTLFGSRK